MEYSEPELVIPALEVLSVFDDLSTSELMTLLRQQLNPTGSDLELLSGRGDDRFSQKVRNLTGSHRTLERKGLATYSDGKFSITNEGRNYLLDHKSTSEALKSQGFDFKDTTVIADADYKGIVIEEGSIHHLSIMVRERSQRITAFAKQHFTNDDGRLLCSGCGFEGFSIYGERGSGLIEIHHLYPLRLSDDKGNVQELLEALTGVAPLCPNCHRLVHRKQDEIMSVDELRRLTEWRV